MVGDASLRAPLCPGLSAGPGPRSGQEKVGRWSVDSEVDAHTTPNSKRIYSNCMIDDIYFKYTPGTGNVYLFTSLERVLVSVSLRWNHLRLINIQVTYNIGLL